MRKVLCYIYEGMADFEITFLLHRLRNTGKMENISISEEDNAVTAQSGLSFVPMKKISEIDAKYTTSCSEEKIKKLGCDDPFFRPNYISQRCVVDRNLITAQGYAFIDFAKEVCEYLQIFDNEKQEYEQIGRVKE